MEKSQVSQLSEKLNRTVSKDFFTQCAFWLLMLMVSLLLIENFLMAHFAISCYDNLYYTVGLIILVFAALTLYYKVRAKEMKSIRCWSLTEYALLFFLIWSIMAVAFSENPGYGLMGSTYRNEGLVTYFIYASAIVLAKQIMTRKHINYFLWFFGVAGFILGIVAAINSEPGFLTLSSWLSCDAMIEDMSSYRSIFYNYNHFAYLLTMVVLVQAGLVVFSKKKIAITAALLMFAVSLAVLIRNKTLGCFFAATIGIVFLICIVGIAQKSSGSRLWLLALAYIAVFVCTQIYDSTIFSSWRTVKDTLSGIDQSFNSTTHRLEMWKESWEYIVKSPIFGVGLDGSGITGFIGGQDRPHNEYIQYALFTGIPGLLAYLTALISLFVSCIRRLKEISNQALIMGAVIVAYCASAFVGNSMYYTTIYYVMFLGFLMGNATASDTNSVS